MPATLMPGKIVKSDMESYSPNGSGGRGFSVRCYSSMRWLPPLPRVNRRIRCPRCQKRVQVAVRVCCEPEVE